MARPDRSQRSYYAVLVDFGWMLLTGCGLLFLVGRWLDQRFGTAPWLSIVGILLGIAVGFKNLFESIVRLERERRRERQGPEPPEPDA